MTYRRLVFAALAVLAAGTLVAAIRSTAANKTADKKAARPAASTTRAERSPGVSKPAAPPKVPATYKSVQIQDVPHVRQKPDFCGEACAAMYLQKLGRPVDQDYVFDQSGLDPMEARGCYTKELAAALRKRPGLRILGRPPSAQTSSPHSVQRLG